jgi:hypothetical protein
MKRSFRVATVFTGAAACAVALTPAAEAAPTAPGATARITPAATNHDCTSKSGQAIHLYYSLKENHTTPACIAGSGSVQWARGKRFASYCGGGYSGYMWIDGGQKRHFTAGVVYHDLYNVSVSKVAISKVYIALSDCRG